MSLTITGFDRPSLIAIKADLDAKLTAVLGPINTAPDSVTGQAIGIVSAALDDVWEAAQAIYDSSYPATATGTALDGAVSYVGLSRKSAAPTTATAIILGAESTFIEVGSICTALDGRKYTTDYAVTIGRARTGYAEITVGAVEAGAIYQIIAGGVSLSYEALAGDDETAIVSGLAALFDPGEFVATAVGDTLRLYRADGKTGFTLTAGSRLTIAKLGTPVAVTCTELGANELPAGALSQMETVIVGVDGITNLVAGAAGRDYESDEALRLRFYQSADVIGSATVKAIRARILDEVAGASYAQVYENRRAYTVDGIPPNSIEVVASGGADSDLAAKIYEVKPAGIETYGTDSAVVTDDNGDGQTVYWSRPIPQYAWVRVTVNALDTEEALQPAYIASIKAAVLAVGAAIGIGKDVITQRFFGPIYAATPGLGSITVEVAVTASSSGAPSYATSNIAVARGYHAVFDLARITVVPL
jgi:uncharacterized phage protein gp47/JayE